MTETINSKRVNAIFGGLFLCSGAVLSCLIFVDRWTELAVRFPSFWYTSRGLHLVICIGLYICGWLALRNSSVSESNDGVAVPLFQSFNFYTRPDCCLCDEAMEVLNGYEDFLPSPSVINIDEDEQFRERFTDCVPVVELDGRIVFKGQVSPELLERLITARQSQQDRRLPFDDDDAEGEDE